MKKTEKRDKVSYFQEFRSSNKNSRGEKNTKSEESPLYDCFRLK